MRSSGVDLTALRAVAVTLAAGQGGGRRPGRPDPSGGLAPAVYAGTGAPFMTDTAKYFVSSRLTNPNWRNSTALGTISAEAIRRLKGRVDSGIYAGRCAQSSSPAACRDWEELIEASPAAGMLHLSRFNETMMRIMSSPAVYIAAVKPCGAGGLESAVCLDVRIAARDTASFILPELLSGLTTTVSGQQSTQLVGPAWVREIVLGARAYSAREVLEIGLVGHAVADADLARSRAGDGRSLRGAHRYTIAAQKRVFNEYALLPPANVLRAEGEMHGDAGGDSVFLASPDTWRRGAIIDLNRDRDP